MSTPHLLVVDDDPGNRELTAEYLRQNGFRATAGGVSDMDALLEDGAVDLIVLALQFGQGEVTRRLRCAPTIPTIVVTGRAEEADLVMALEMGAEDFLAKPFSPRELVARIRSVLRRRRSPMRRGRPEGVRAFRFDAWELNLNTRRVTRPDGGQAPLTRVEFSLLTALLAAPGRVLSRDRLLDGSRLDSGGVTGRAIDVQVARLRVKVETDPARPRCILTERGAGYRLGVPVEALY